MAEEGEKKDEKSTLNKFKALCCSCCREKGDVVAGGPGDESDPEISQKTSDKNNVVFGEMTVIKSKPIEKSDKDFVKEPTSEERKGSFLDIKNSLDVIKTKAKRKGKKKEVQEHQDAMSTIKPTDSVVNLAQGLVSKIIDRAKQEKNNIPSEISDEQSTVPKKKPDEQSTASKEMADEKSTVSNDKSDQKSTVSNEKLDEQPNASKKKLDEKSTELNEKLDEQPNALDDKSKEEGTDKED